MIDDTMMLLMNRYLLLFIIHKLIDFHDKLNDNDDEIISLLETHIDVDTDMDISTISSVIECFIMDIFTDILQMHYDSRWIISNLNQSDLAQRLSKQKEKEKQSFIQTLDTMSDEKRHITMELQKTGQSNWYRTSGEENTQRVIDEYSNAPDNERYEVFNSLLVDDDTLTEAMNIHSGEIPLESEFQILTTVQEDQSGYYDENDIDEDGQMGDELHEFNDEDTLDNDFHA